MKILVCLLSFALLAVAPAQQKRSLLDSDPDVVYLEEHLDRPIELMIVREAPIYGDKDGKRQLGTVQADQKVVLQAMTDRAYRVSARTKGNKMVGWVGPHAFGSSDPDFVEHLAAFYERQIEVAKLIAAHQVAIGMTLDEVGKSRGAPTKTKMRRTTDGKSGRWEFIDYKDVNHYRYVSDPVTGQVFRQLSHVTREEKGRTVVEFEDDIVTAIEESENNDGARVRIIVPPVVFRW